jgi:hypothetical protein
MPRSGVRQGQNQQEDESKWPFRQNLPGVRLHELP